jgi:hypothetical protein
MESGRPSRLRIAVRTTPYSTFEFPRMEIFLTTSSWASEISARKITQRRMNPKRHTIPDELLYVLMGTG